MLEDWFCPKTNPYHFRFFAPIVTKPIRTIGGKNELEAWGFDAVYLSLIKTEENRSWSFGRGDK